MNEFTDIYRLFAKNYSNIYFRKGWPEEDVALLKEKLDEVGALIENGDIAIKILKREIDNNGGVTLKNALEQVVQVVFEIEAIATRSDQKKHAEHVTEPMIEIDKKTEKRKKARLDKIPQDRLVAPFKEILHKYNNAAIYKEVYDHLLEKLPNKFNHDDIYNSIKNIYLEKPKRELSHKTLQTYAKRYIDYMKENKKIKIDKDSGMYIRITQNQITETPEKPGGNGRWVGIFPKEQILAKYNTVYIYKPIVDEIMDPDNLPDGFIGRDLTQFLFNYYNHVLKKKISMKSADIYKGKYVKYLVENNLLKEEKIEGEKDKKFTKIKDEKPKITIVEKEDKKVEKPARNNSEIQQPVSLVDSETLDEAIYNYAMRFGWSNVPSIPIITIERRFSKSTIDEIKTALSKLIQKGKASQSHPPGRIKFKKVDV